MAEQIVEEVGLAEVIELLGLADPPGHREAAIGQVVEEREFGQQAFHAHELPTGGLAQHRVEVVELGDAVGRHAHRALVAQELVARAAHQHLLLAFEQRRPHPVVVAGIARPGLLHHGRRVHRHVALVGELVFDAVGGGGDGVGHGGTEGCSCEDASRFGRNGLALLRRSSGPADDPRAKFA
jgi:hypothetical protein